MSMVFPERLKELRLEKKLNQAELGAIFNIAQVTISSWERGNSSPSIEELKIIADYFDVSADYLLGREEI